MIDKATLERNFSKNASRYDSVSTAQALSAGELIGLDGRTKYGKVLEVGCGTGSYTSLLSKKYERAAITSIDISDAMLDIARAKMRGSNVYFIKGDIEEARLDGGYDLITSNAAFQWLEDLDRAMERMAGMLTKDGTLCFSAYGPETFRELNKVLSKVLGKRKWLTSADFPGFSGMKKILEKYFDVVSFYEKKYVVRFASLLDMLKNIRSSGARGRGLDAGVRLGRDMIEKLDAVYRASSSGIKATHQIFFCKARLKGGFSG